MPTSSIDREVEQRLRASDVRYTRGRRSVVAALVVADGPKSAAELHGLIGSAVPLSSLYRSLAVLEDAGVVVPHFGAKVLTRYELAEWIAGHHHHLICLECGAVEDIDVPVQIEERVRTAVAEIGDRAGFVPSGHVLEIEGRCARCN